MNLDAPKPQTYNETRREIIHIINLTFNEFFFQALVESWLSLQTKQELIEFMFAEHLMNKNQYKRSLSHARHFNNLHSRENAAK